MQEAASQMKGEFSAIRTELFMQLFIKAFFATCWNCKF